MATIKFPTFPTFPNVDLSKLDLSKIDFSKIDFSKIDVSKLDLGKLPKPNLPGIDADAVLGAAKDAGYITVGLGVLAVQKVQQARREIVKSVTDQFSSKSAT